MRPLNIFNDPEIEDEFDDYDMDSRNHVEHDYNYRSEQRCTRDIERQRHNYNHYRDRDTGYYDDDSRRSRFWDSRRNTRGFYNTNCNQRKFNTPIGDRQNNRFNTRKGNWQRKNGAARQVIFYLLLFIVLAVLFKWVILKNAGMTAVAVFVIILVFCGHLRDK